MDIETLTVSIEAKTDRLAAGMRQAQQITASTSGAMRRDAAAAADSIAESHGEIEQAAHRAGTSQIILQSLIRRSTDQFAAGAPVATIFAEHVSGLAEAATFAGGSFGKVGEILAGPWGLAMSAAVSIASVLAQHLFEDSEATNVHKKAVVTLADALVDLNSVTGQSVRLHSEDAAAAGRHAAGLYEESRAIRDQTKARLEQALVEERAKGVQAQGFGQRGELGAIGAGIASNRVGQLQALLDEQNKKVATNAKSYLEGFRGLRADELLAGIKNRTDESAAATDRYERSIRKLRDGLAAGTITEQKFAEQALAATRARDAATKRGRGGSGAGDADADARLATATTGVQRAEAQLAVTRRDAAKQLAAHTITQSEYENRIESGMRAVNEAREAAKGHASAVREQAAAERDLSSSLEQLQSRYDPIAVAARAYTDALKDIDNLLKGHRIDETTADLYRQQAALENIADTTAAITKQNKAARDDAFLGQPKSAIDIPDKLPEVQISTKALLKGGPFDEDAIKRQQKNIDTLAGYFENAFEGRGGNFFEEFKRQGIAAVAEIVARLALTGKLDLAGTGGAAGAGGVFGKLLGAVGSLFGGGRASAASLGLPGVSNVLSLAGGAPDLSGALTLPGFAGGRATGGPVDPGRTYLVGERGPELLHTGRLAGTIIPNIGSANGTIRSVVREGDRHYHVNVNAENSVTPADFGKNLARQVLEEADRMDQRKQVSTLQQVPQAQRYYSQLQGR